MVESLGGHPGGITGTQKEQLGEVVGVRGGNSSFGLKYLNTKLKFEETAVAAQPTTLYCVSQKHYNRIMTRNLEVIVSKRMAFVVRFLGLKINSSYFIEMMKRIKKERYCRDQVIVN